MIPLQNTTQQPDLLPLTDRATREKLFDQRWTATEKGDANDTRATIAEIAQLRAEKAKLLGYPNYAAYALYDQMAKTPGSGGWLPQAAGAGHRGGGAARGQGHPGGDRQVGRAFPAEALGLGSLCRKVRKARYDLDEAELKPYFELNTVLKNGVFYAANRLYGLTFKQRKDIPVWQPDVLVFEVFDVNGKPLGLMYFDYFKRDNKSGGAWMSNLVEQSHLLGTQAGDLQRGQFHQAGARPARASHLRRRHHHVPRIRPCPAWLFRGPGVSHPVRHGGGARLRGVPVPVQ